MEFAESTQKYDPINDHEYDCVRKGFETLWQPLTMGTPCHQTVQTKSCFHSEKLYYASLKNSCRYISLEVYRYDLQPIAINVLYEN